MHRLNIYAIGRQTANYRDILGHTLHYRSLTCVKNVNSDDRLTTLCPNSSKQKTHCAVINLRYTTKRQFSCSHCKYVRKLKPHEPREPQRELENKKSKTTSALPIAAQILYNVDEDGEHVDKDTESVLTLDENLDGSEGTLKLMAAEIREAQEALEATSVDEEYDVDDDDDYVEEVSFITKSEAAALEKNEKLKSAQLLFGTPDPTIAMSDIPCCGCGAKLHCKDPGIPGKRENLPTHDILYCPNIRLRNIKYANF